MGKCFIVEFPLKTELYQEHILNKRFEIARHIYNSLLNIMLKRYNEMIKTCLYRECVSNLKKANKKVQDSARDKLKILRRQYGFSEYDFFSQVKPLQKHFSDNIDSNVARSIASNAWRAFSDLLFGKAKKIRFKKHGEINTLRGKTNDSGIRFIDNMMTWSGQKMKKKLCIPVNEKAFTLKELMEADEVIVSSSSNFCMQATVIDGKPVGGKAPELLKKLQDALMEDFLEATN